MDDWSICRKTRHPALAGLVTEIWAMRLGPDPCSPAEILPADSKTELVFSFGADTEWERSGGGRQSLRGHFVSGPRMGYRIMRSSGPVHYVAASLAPGAARAIFGPEAAGLGELDTELPDLRLAGMMELDRRMAETSASRRRPPAPREGEEAELEGALALDELRLATLEEALASLASARGEGAPDGIAAALRLAAAGRLRASSVAALSDILGVGYKRLERASYRSFGLGPKELLRLGRLARAQRAIRAGRTRWAELAAELGFADQSHLVREFRALTSLTPEAWKSSAEAGSA